MSIGKRPNVIQDVMTAFEYGNLIPTAHAQEQMDKRDVQMSDIEEMINNAHREEGKDSLRKDNNGWKYALRGFNKSADKDIRIIIFFNDSDAVIVTVIDKNKKKD